MKITILPKFLAVNTVVGLCLLASTALADNPPATGQMAQLSYGASQVMQLEQAKVGDDTIIAYIKNSGNGYGLDANQIIYLRQQGVSDPVITAMLNQPKTTVVAAAPVAAAPVAAAPASVSAEPTAPLLSPRQMGEQDSDTYVAPAVTYVQTVPAAPYYQPYYYPAYGYYPYAWYPPVTFSFGWGWGGGWRGGGGWHGGGWHH